MLPAAELAFNSVGVDRVRSLRAVEAIAERSRRVGESRTVDKVLSLLQTRYGMIDTVALLRAAC